MNRMTFGELVIAIASVRKACYCSISQTVVFSKKCVCVLNRSICTKGKFQSEKNFCPLQSNNLIQRPSCTGREGGKEAEREKRAKGEKETESE